MARWSPLTLQEASQYIFTGSSDQSASMDPTFSSNYNTTLPNIGYKGIYLLGKIRGKSSDTNN